MRSKDYRSRRTTRTSRLMAFRSYGELLEHVDRAALQRGVVGLVAVDPSRRAVLCVRANGDGSIGCECNAEPEPVARPCIGGLEVCLLRPRPCAACEDVRRAAVCGGVVPLISVDAIRSAVLQR